IPALRRDYYLYRSQNTGTPNPTFTSLNVACVTP
ncbi:hypothetical protein AZZ63_002626, partial [Enterobacter hormaechei]